MGLGVQVRGLWGEVLEVSWGVLRESERGGWGSRDVALTQVRAAGRGFGDT